MDKLWTLKCNQLLRSCFSLSARRVLVLVDEEMMRWKCSIIGVCALYNELLYIFIRLQRGRLHDVFAWFLFQYTESTISTCTQRVRTYSLHAAEYFYTHSRSCQSAAAFSHYVYSVSNFTLRLFCFFLFVFLVAGASAVYQVTEYSKYTNHNIVPYSLYGFIY